MKNLLKENKVVRFINFIVSMGKEMPLQTVGQFSLQLNMRLYRLICPGIVKHEQRCGRLVGKV